MHIHKTMKQMFVLYSQCVSFTVHWDTLYPDSLYLTPYLSSSVIIILSATCDQEWDKHNNSQTLAMIVKASTATNIKTCIFNLSFLDRKYWTARTVPTVDINRNQPWYPQHSLITRHNSRCFISCVMFLYLNTHCWMEKMKPQLQVPRFCSH
jgi:hypothetical protein